jgi:hypothetical protein
MPVRIITKAEQDQYGQNGFISQSVDSGVYKEASDKEKEKINKLPILGNIKNFESSPAANDGGGSMGEMDEDDDLPF